MVVKMESSLIFMILSMLLIISEARKVDNLNDRKILTLGSSNPLRDHSTIKNVIMKRETPGGPNPLHNSNPPQAPSGFNVIVKKETPGGPNPLHDSNPLQAPSGFNVIVKRETPGGP
ncbi:hypothetical protein Gohar_019821, partial [Gossypium harknessii]|nr:hypothetical protein [Gossypium harknessii]MBA0819244.1 hypothetical protein [Gossypium harknessii]